MEFLVGPKNESFCVSNICFGRTWQMPTLLRLKDMFFSRLSCEQGSIFQLEPLYWGREAKRHTCCGFVCSLFSLISSWPRSQKTPLREKDVCIFNHQGKTHQVILSATSTLLVVTKHHINPSKNPVVSLILDFGYKKHREDDDDGDHKQRRSTTPAVALWHLPSLSIHEELEITDERCARRCLARTFWREK